jgi:histone-lysine N-methyltransferase SETMAR
MDLPPLFFRYVILHKYFEQRLSEINAAQTAIELKAVYGESSPNERKCERWFARFKQGDYSLEDKLRSGRPSEVDEEKLEAIRKANPRQTEEEMGEQLGISHQVVSYHLRAADVKWKYGRQVPHALSDDNKFNRLPICSALLSRHNSKHSFLSKIVTGDESWIFYINFKRKRQHLRAGELGVPDVKPDPHRPKTMLCIFWDMKGVIYFELLTGKTTLNKDEYCRQLRELDNAIREKRPEKTKVVFQRDNAKPHVANLTKDTIKELGWEVMVHPAWSPDLAPSDYALFRSLKDNIAEKQFEDQDDLKNYLNHFFASKSPKFYADAIRELPKRWSLVVDCSGDYFDDL